MVLTVGKRKRIQWTQSLTAFLTEVGTKEDRDTTHKIRRAVTLRPSLRKTKGRIEQGHDRISLGQ